MAELLAGGPAAAPERDPGCTRRGLVRAIGL